MSDKFISSATRIFEFVLAVVAVSAILIQMGGRFERQDTMNRTIEKFEQKIELYTSQNSADHTTIKLDIKEIQTQLTSINRKLQ